MSAAKTAVDVMARSGAARFRALLTAGWLSPLRAAAQVTLRSAISVSNTTNRLRSTDRKFHSLSEVGGMYFASYSDDDCDAWRASDRTQFRTPVWHAGT
jgi:hypothetical protein